MPETIRRSPLAALGARTGGRIAMLGALALSAGCDTLDRALDVQAPSRIPAELLEEASNADLLVRGAVGDFECALNAYIVLAGSTADELTDATQTANRWVYDRREILPSDDRYAVFGCENLGTYTPLSTARWAAENALSRLQTFTDAQVEDRQALIATAAAYSAYSHVLLGEGFCSGVLLDAELEPGGEVPPEALFQRAEERFTLALETARAAGADSLVDLALAGRARARLNLGRFDEAAADAVLVPDDFLWVATASGGSVRRQNRIFDQSVTGENVSVAEPFRGLEFEGVADPRVRVIDTGETATDGTPIFLQTKYGSVDAPIPVASADEARLIAAEAAARAGDVETAVSIINALHARAGLPPFAAATAAEALEQVVEERSRELFLEGQRFFDVRRLGLPLVPAPGTPFDNGGFYGDDRCWPLPDVERRNNPNVG